MKRCVVGGAGVVWPIPMWVASMFAGVNEEDFLSGMQDFEVKTERIRAQLKASGDAELLQQLHDQVDVLFGQLDRDHSGGLERDEMIGFHGGDETGYLALIDTNKEEFSAPKADRFKADIATLEAQIKAMQAKSDTEEHIEANFERLRTWKLEFEKQANRPVTQADLLLADESIRRTARRLGLI